MICFQYTAEVAEHNLMHSSVCELFLYFPRKKMIEEPSAPPPIKSQHTLFKPCPQHKHLHTYLEPTKRKEKYLLIMACMAMILNYI